MILCKRCRRVWPSGTTYCQVCGGSLGSRICPDQHLNALDASFCRTFGSHRLSRGVPAANLRMVTVLITVLVVALLGRVAAELIWLSILSLASAIWRALIPVVAHLIVWSLLLGLFGGPRVREALMDGWATLLRSAFVGAGNVVKAILSLGLKGAKKRKGARNP